MAKVTPPRNLSSMEKKIISLMQENGRIPFVKVAKQLDVTEGTVRRKFNKLEKEGIIKITALCNPHMIGYDSPAFIGISAEHRSIDSLVKQISKIPEVQFTAVTTGPYEIMTQVVATSNKHLYELIVDIAELKGVTGTYTFLILDIHKHSREFGT